MFAPMSTSDTKQPTIAEVNGELITACNGFDVAVNRLAANKIDIHPSIHLEYDGAALPTTCLPRAEPTPYLQALVEDKTMRAKERVKNYLSSTVQNTSLARVADIACDLMDKYLSTKDLSQKQTSTDSDTDKLLAWHPHRNMLAIAQKDGVVYVYEKDASSVQWKQTVLKHQLMRNITCLEWKLRTSGTLAVGCRDGVCVWTIGNKSKDNTSMNYLCYPGHTDIRSVAWDPSPASHLLATASGTSATLVIFDLLFMQSTPLRREGDGSRLLRWSPDGQWLYVASIGGTSRMWDTRTWHFIEMKNPPGLWVQSACWSPDSQSLLISMVGKDDIHSIYWSNPSVAAELRHDKVFSISKSTSRGSSIKEIILDPYKGERLAVIFDDSDAIELYAFKRPNSLDLNAKSSLKQIGSIRGADVTCYDTDVSAGKGSHKIKLIENAKPVIAAFSPSFGKNYCLLATLYDNNTISFVTHCF